MRWCRFQSGGESFYGIVEGDNLTENIKDGDVVEIEVPTIGVLRNLVIREE